MKLRIRGNSIRLRLTRGEVEEFGKTGRVEESVDFGTGNSKFTYAVETLNGDEKIFAVFDNERLCVYVPEAIVRDWVKSNDVGIEGGNGGPRILIEKDFACLKERPGESDSDAFPNPTAAGC